jgi:hypothetical protein
MTPATCTESCNGSGGVIMCNGQVVYVASSVVDAGQWYIAHLDAQFDISKFTVTGSAACTGNDCSVKASCAATPQTNKMGGAGLFLAAIGFAAFGAHRRLRRAR